MKEGKYQFDLDFSESFKKELEFFFETAREKIKIDLNDDETHTGSAATWTMSKIFEDINKKFDFDISDHVHFVIYFLDMLTEQLGTHFLSLENIHSLKKQKLFEYIRDSLNEVIIKNFPDKELGE